MFANNDQYHTSESSVYTVSEKQTVTNTQIKLLVNFLGLPFIDYI